LTERYRLADTFETERSLIGFARSVSGDFIENVSPRGFVRATINPVVCVQACLYGKCQGDQQAQPNNAGNQLKNPGHSTIRQFYVEFPHPTE
jgi:hypothetical protein